MDKKIVVLLVLSIVAVVAIAGVMFLRSDGGGSESQEPSPAADKHYYEIVGTVTNVADGDTFSVMVDNIVADIDPASEITVRPSAYPVRFGGGIDAPETGPNGEKGGEEATEFVRTFLYSGVKVYLDLDNLAVGGQEERPYRGEYGRLIAVIYTKFDNQWININANLLKWGMREFPGNNWSEYTNIESEFSLYNWPPYDNEYPYVYPETIDI